MVTPLRGSRGTPGRSARPRSCRRASSTPTRARRSPTVVGCSGSSARPARASPRSPSPASSTGSGRRAERGPVPAPRPDPARRGGAARPGDAAVGGTSREPLARTARPWPSACSARPPRSRGSRRRRCSAGPSRTSCSATCSPATPTARSPAPAGRRLVRRGPPTRGFRHELRDLFMRAAEQESGRQDLHRLGGETAARTGSPRPAVLAEYEQVMTLGSPERPRPRLIVGAATELLVTDAAARDRIRDRCGSSSSTTPRR